MYRHEVLIARSTPTVAAEDAAYGPLWPSVFTHAGSWARRARFTVVIHAVNGAPSTWSLKATPEDAVLHDGNLWRYQKRRWFPVGEQFDIADNTTDLATPFVFTWETDTIGADIRLNRSLTFTGGTSPSLDMTVTRELWS